MKYKMAINQWIKKYGSGKIILGADCKSRMIATHGWIKESTLDVISFIQQYEKLGISNVICTDVAKDGLLQVSPQLYGE